MPIYKLNSETIEPVPATAFAWLGIGERSHIQRALRDQIDVIDGEILVISEEFAQWADSQRRIDLLGIDRNGCVVVIELKRTEDGGHMDLQAIRYAAMVSTLTFEQACDIYESYLEQRGRDADAREELLKHLGAESSDETELSGEVRIVLVAPNFAKEITTAALWLYESGIDIRCVRISPYNHNGECLLDVQQLIPLPEAADYQVGVRDKRQRQRAKAKNSRDLQRFTLRVNGDEFTNLPKRQAIRILVNAMLENGIAPEAINDAIPWRSVVYPIPRDETGEPSIDLLSSEFKVSKPRQIWFVDDEYRVVVGGESYVIAKQWSKRTEEALRLLVDKFRPANISYKIED